MPGLKNVPITGKGILQGKRLFLLLVLTGVVLVAGGLYLWTERSCPDPGMVTITTDRPEYTSAETVQVSILNAGNRPVDIFCPSWCALGNFPTTLERLTDGRWEYSHGFCPSIGSPLENRGVPEGDYLRHTLPSGGSFQLGLSNLGALHLREKESFRVVYYLCGGREPVYSGAFTITP